MALGERLAEAEPTGVRVAVELAGCRLERGHRRRQRAERPLVGGELHDPLEPELGLELAHRALRPVRLYLDQCSAQRHASSLGRTDFAPRIRAEIVERFPLFPLGLVLLPREVVPLHIFEERYKVMIGECLDAGREFGILWLADDGLREIGCSAEITEVLERTDDGRMNILVQGTRPLRLLRRLDELDYPAGDIELLDEDPPGEEGAAGGQARARYAELVEKVTDSRPSDSDLGDLDAYGMAATLDFALEAKQDLLEQRSESERLGIPRRAVLGYAPPPRALRARRRAGAGERESTLRGGLGEPPGWGTRDGFQFDREDRGMRLRYLALVGGVRGVDDVRSPGASAASYDADTVIVKFKPGTAVTGDGGRLDRRQRRQGAARGR